jgi:hypothetical protein
VRGNGFRRREVRPEEMPYPIKINTAVGGYLADPDTSLKESILAAVKAKIQFNHLRPDNQEAQRTQQQVGDLCNAIASDDGWESKICIATETAQMGQQGMCYLTAVKHLSYTDADLKALEQALKTSVSLSPQPPIISDFKIVPLDDVLRGAARGNAPAAIVNGLAVDGLNQSHAFNFKDGESARLHLTVL